MWTGAKMTIGGGAGLCKRSSVAPPGVPTLTPKRGSADIEQTSQVYMSFQGREKLKHVPTLPSWLPNVAKSVTPGTNVYHLMPYWVYAEYRLSDEDYFNRLQL